MSATAASSENELLRYPIGRRQRSETVTAEQRAANIQILEDLPRHLRAAVDGLTEAQLDTTYRPGGWTVRQVVHHVADSHANGYIRTRLLLTEEAPPVKPYQEALWAELADAKNEPVEVSLQLIDALHRRWTVLLRSLTDADFARLYRHPESGDASLDQAVALYAWHSQHHTAHITSLRQREGW